MENINEELVNYLTKLRNTVDFLARGYILEDLDQKIAVEIASNTAVMERQAVSICEYNIYDELEIAFFGEQKSIGILMEYLEDGEYERQIDGKIDFTMPYVPENPKFYNMVMKKIKIILRMMAEFLISGNKIPLNDYDYRYLKLIFLDIDEMSYDEDDKNGYLIYNVSIGSFSVISLDGETVIDEIDIDTGMNLFSKFLDKREQEILYDMEIKSIRKNEERE